MGGPHAQNRRSSDPARQASRNHWEDLHEASAHLAGPSNPATAPSRCAVGAMILSIQAMAWAIQQQEVTEPVTRFVLLCLANYAGSDGNAACPSALSLARDTGLSERAVRLHLRKLEQMALIMRGNQAFAAAKIPRADRRPIVWNLIMSRGASDAPRRGASDAGRDVTGCTGERHGVHMTTERGAPRAPNPKDLSEGEPKRAENRLSWEEEFRKRYGCEPPKLDSPPQSPPTENAARTGPKRHRGAAGRQR